MALLLKQGTLIESDKIRKADLFIEQDKISRIAEVIPENELPEGTEIMDVEGFCVLPGIIDAHTHYHLISRGTVTADSFAEGSRLAAYGGVTTVIDFADHDKTRPLAAAARDRIEALSQEMTIDFSLHQGVYEMNPGIPEQLKQVKALGITAIKIFTTYKNAGYLIETDGLRDLFTACRDLELMVCVHAEDDKYLQDIEKSHGDSFTPYDHALLRPSEAEYRAIRYVGELALELDMPLYIVHVSSERGLAAVRELRAAGAKLTVETTPHYLLLTEDKLKQQDAPLYVMTPPLRTHNDTVALWEALLDEEIDIVATDHCSFTHTQKLTSHDCRTIFPGIPGTEELLPLIHTFGVVTGRMSIQEMVAILSENPAKAFGLYPRKGSLAIGSDADLVIFDPEASWKLTAEEIHSASGYTAYEGLDVVGKPITTLVRGVRVMSEGTYLGKEGTGSFVPAGTPGSYSK